MDKNMNFSQKQQDELLTLAAKKLGISEDKLKNQLDKGAVEDIVKQAGAGGNMAQVNQILNNPTMLQQMLSSPQAADILRKIMGG